ncbi:MAG: hypothetical protein BWX71_02846 [Deltaproteobacteria bacterium ADurb.Bin072]|nr:MAG: hypothetical protein BWX71_02846 [Deltaproteobacteria bacterium ADurb.Bin072]
MTRGSPLRKTLNTRPSVDRNDSVRTSALSRLLDALSTGLAVSRGPENQNRPPRSAPKNLAAAETIRVRISSRSALGTNSSMMSMNLSTSSCRGAPILTGAPTRTRGRRSSGKKSCPYPLRPSQAMRARLRAEVRSCWPCFTRAISALVLASSMGSPVLSRSDSLASRSERITSAWSPLPRACRALNRKATPLRWRLGPARTRSISCSSPKEGIGANPFSSKAWSISRVTGQLY